MTHQVATGPERIVAFDNPGSSHAAEAEGYLSALAEKLRDDKLDFVCFPTEREPEANVEMMEQNLQAGDAVVIFGGDRTANLILSGLAKLRLPYPAAPLLGGNANDISHMLHTARNLRHPEQIFRHGRIVPLTPLEITIEMPDGATETVYSFANWSLGGSALGGSYFADTARRVGLQQLEHKKFGKLRRLAAESELAIQGLHDVDTTILSGDLEVDNLLDLSISNGPRMAKILPFTGIKLHRAEAGLIVTRRDRWDELSLAKTVARSALGRLVHLDTSTDLKFQAETGQGGPLIAQSDGEAYHLPSGSQLRVGLADRSVNVYTTRR